MDDKLLDKKLDTASRNDTPLGDGLFVEESCADTIDEAISGEILSDSEPDANIGNSAGSEDEPSNQELDTNNGGDTAPGESPSDNNPPADSDTVSGDEQPDKDSDIDTGEQAVAGNGQPDDGERNADTGDDTANEDNVTGTPPVQKSGGNKKKPNKNKAKPATKSQTRSLPDKDAADISADE